MDSSLSLSSWYTGIHCYALYQSWWQKIQSSCHFPFFQAAKSGNNGLGSVIESSQALSWSKWCHDPWFVFRLNCLRVWAIDLRSHLIFWKESLQHSHLWKAQGSSADQGWCGKTRWKWRTTGLSASEWVHSARESDGWQGGGGMVTIGQGMN